MRGPLFACDIFIWLLPMKLLIVSQYFWPESFIINALTQTLAAQGHDITVATGKPNYPDGCVFAGYNAAGVLRETFSESVDVMRVPLRPRGAGGGAKPTVELFFICLVRIKVVSWPSAW